MSDLEATGTVMRDDWDRRAREDASYYVAFGRRKQSKDEFFGSAKELVHGLLHEFKHFPAGAPLSELSAIEIGCGPGRVMLPLSEHFGYVTGVDVSGEMVELARRNLEGVPNAEVRQSSGSDLSGFEDESFDFCYSYAVFQHIPDREAIWSYLREARRVLKPGGLLKAQANSLPQGDQPPIALVPGWSLRAGAGEGSVVREQTPDTWSGASIRGEEIAQFAHEQGLQLLAMDGFDTQYLWFTARKPHPDDPPQSALGEAKIIVSTNALTSDRSVPQGGRFATASFQVANLGADADLNTLRVEIDGQLTAPCFVRRKTFSGEGQVNVSLPPGVRTGMLPAQLLMNGKPISNRVALRVTPAPVMIPRIASVTDGVNLLSDISIESRSLKITLEEVDLSADDLLDAFAADLNGFPIEDVNVFQVDPLTRRYEVNLELPDDIPTGPANLNCRVGSRKLWPFAVNIAA